MTHPTQTAGQKYADSLLEVSLSDYLAGKRAMGLSYERIARDLHEDTDGEVSVSLQTIKRWCNDYEVTA